jgi:hypothetical protein
MTNQEIIDLWRASNEPSFTKWLENNEGILNEDENDQD